MSMTDNQWATLGKIAAPAWLGTILGIILMIPTCHGHAENGPCLRLDSPRSLLCYIGAAEDSDRIAVGTTWSVSPNRDIGPPFDEATENPDAWWRVEDLQYDRGWIRVPVPDVRIEMPYGSGTWLLDDHVRVQVHYAPAAVGLCSVSACGARLIYRRGDLSDVVPAPTNSRRRAVTP